MLVGSFVQGLWPVDAAVKFPIGTLVVNVLGCLVFGILGYLGQHTSHLSEFWRTVLLTGLLGSFTTFSTFSYENYLLLHDAPHGKLFYAAANIGLNVGLGLVAIVVGVQIAKLFTA